MNYYAVQVSKVPGPMSTITVEGGATVADALELAHITMEPGYEIRMDNEIVALGTEITSDSVIILTKMIKGNN